MIIDPGNSGVGKSNTNAANSNKIGKSQADNAAKTANSDNSSPNPGDSVSLSSKGQALGKLAQAVSLAPDVDTDKVARIQQQIADGSYQLNSNKIAEGMLTQDSLF